MEALRFLKKYKKAIFVTLLSFLMFLYFLHVSLKRELGPFEIVILQFFVLGLGMYGSFTFGKQSQHSVSKSHARSAFRRVWALYQSLSQILAEIERDRKKKQNSQELVQALDKVGSLLSAQLLTADVALEDWRDIVPEEVSEIEENLEENKRGG